MSQTAMGSDADTGPDYPLDRTLEVASPQRLKAIGNETRMRILAMLSQRAATTSEVAEALGRPKGTVGHHLKVLEAAKLIRVVRTRKVRALTAKYYGRTARTFVIKSADGDRHDAFAFLAEAQREACFAEDRPGTFTLRHARVPDDRAAEFGERLVTLAEEFSAQPPGGTVVYGLLAGVYPTDRPGLRDEEGK